MSIAFCATGEPAIAHPTGVGELGNKGKAPPKRQLLAKPDLPLSPEAR